MDTRPKSEGVTPAPDRPDPEAGGPITELSRLHVWQIQAVRDILLVALVVALLWAGYAMRAVTVPLLVALLLAYLFEPLVARISDHPRMNRKTAVGLLMGTVGVVVLIGLGLIIPVVVAQTDEILEQVRDGTMNARVAKLESYVPEMYRDDFLRFAEYLPGKPARQAPPDGAANATTAPAVPPGSAAGAPDATPDADEIDRRIAAQVDRLREELAAERETGTEGWKLLATGAKRGAGAVAGVIGSIISLGLLLFLIPFYLFFFSVWYPDVTRFGRELIPERNQASTLHLLGRMDAVVAGFVRGRIVISALMGIMLAVGWSICGVPWAITLGLVVGVLCAVPYLGGVGVPVAVGLLLFHQQDAPEAERMGMLWIIAGPTIVFAIVQLIEGYVLTPAIAGNATNLDPVTILVAVLAGGSVLGVYGMLLAIPAVACGKILATDVVLPKIRAWTRGEIADPLPIDRD